MATPMQKLIWPTTENAYLREGSALLAGPVVRIADAIAWSTPNQVLDAYGIQGDGAPSIDVLRFAPAPTSVLSVPAPGSPSAIAGYDLGFLRGGGGAVPVWDIAPTEVPRGAELWRIHEDGRQEMLTAYAGPAFGWRSTGVYAPPSLLVGPRATWNGMEYVASFIDDEQIELVAVGDEAPEGFEQTRPGIYRRLVAAAQCESVFERAYTAKWNSVVPCRVVQTTGRETAILLEVDAARANAFDAVMLEPGVFWKVVPAAEIDAVQGVATEWAPEGSGAE